MSGFNNDLLVGSVEPRIERIITFNKKLNALLDEYLDISPAYAVDNMSNDTVHELACLLGVIGENLIEHSDIIDSLTLYGIDCSKEADGYNCIFSLLFMLSECVSKRI